MDLADPAAPAWRGTYDTPGITYGLALDSTGSLAYLADGTGGLKILSLSDPNHLTLVGSLSLTGIMREVAVAGGVAYLANQSGTLTVVDVSTSSTPRWIGEVLLSGAGIHVSVEGTRVVVLSSNSTNDVLDLLDVSVPSSPRLVGSVAVGPPGTGKGVTLVGGRAYVAADTMGLKIYGLGAAPTPQGGVNDTFLGQSIAAAAGLAIVVGKDIPTNTALLKVLDVNPPSDPLVVGQLGTSAVPSFTAVALNSTATLAVVGASTAGLWVVDLTNPAVPLLRGTYDTPGQAYGVALNSAATLAYVADGTGDLQIVNLSNPAAPTLAGSLSLLGIMRGVAVAGGVVYLANQSGTLEVVDVSVSSAPRRIGGTLLSGPGFHVAIEGTRAVAVSETSTNSVLDVLDISIPASPILLGSVPIGPPGTAKGLTLAGGRAYVAANSTGLKIYNLSNPLTPVLLTTLGTIGTALDVAVDGSLAYVADFPATVDIFALP